MCMQVDVKHYTCIHAYTYVHLKSLSLPWKSSPESSYTATYTLKHYKPKFCEQGCLRVLARCRRLPILPSREARVPKTIRPNTLAVAAVPAIRISDPNVGPRFAARLLRRFVVASVEHLQKSNVRSHVNPCGNDYAINWSAFSTVVFAFKNT